MGTSIRKEEVDFVRQLKRLGILLPVDPTKRDYRRGITPVICADCHQRRDIEGHLEGLMREAGVENPLVHALKLNGGAATIALDERMNPGDHKGQALLMDIGGTARPDVKGIKLIALYGHWPCGQALLMGVTLPEMIELLMRGETRAKEHHPHLKVDCYFHVDFGPEYRRFGKGARRKTYFMSHRAWLDWKHRVQRSAPYPGRDHDPAQDRILIVR